MYNLYRDNIAFAQYCGGAGRKMWGCRKKNVAVQEEIANEGSFLCETV